MLHAKHCIEFPVTSRLLKTEEDTLNTMSHPPERWKFELKIFINVFPVSSILPQQLSFEYSLLPPLEHLQTATANIYYRASAVDEHLLYKLPFSLS